MFDTTDSIIRFLNYCAYNTKITMEVNGLYTGSRIPVQIQAKYVNHDENGVKVIEKHKHHPRVYQWDEIETVGSGW